MSANHPEHQYLDLLRDCLENGTYREGRNGGTYGLFGRQIRFDLQQGFPLLTTKRVHWKSVAVELLWFLRGEGNAKWLEDQGVSIWREWGDPISRYMGPIYGVQWRRQEQISFVRPHAPEVPEIVLDASRVAGVGTGGECRVGNEEMYSVWNEMLHRCYDPKRKSFQEYGARGCHVATRWHHFPNFLADVVTLPGWHLKKAFPREYTLDKDFRASRRYGPDVCRWASIREQRINTRRADAGVVVVTYPDGEVRTTMDVASLCADHGLDESSVYKCLRGERESHKGFRLERVTPQEGLVPRVRLIDQISEVIASIKADPNGRRHIVTAWNPAEIEDMALPPCHCLFQFFVADGKLSCQLYQRSADVFLGVPFNIASYALLTHLIAHEVGLEVGEFVHTFGDVHLYANHVEQAKEQLTRLPRPFPRLIMHHNAVAENKGIFDLEFSDLGIVSYDPHPVIKAEVSV